MGYILNIPPRESQIQASIKSAADKEKFDAIDNAIENEISARQSSDADIIANVNQLSNNLSNEIARRAADDSALQTAISNEATLSKKRDETLKSDLTASIQAEQSARQSSDADIIASVNQLSNNLSDEITLRAADDLSLLQTFQAAIDSETNARSSAISNLQRQINSEIADRTAGDNSLRQDFISADSALLNTVNNKFDPLISNLNTAISNEATLSKKRDDTLKSDFAASIQAEQSARSNADSSLQSSLSAEIATRKSQTDSLSSAITKEISDRTTAFNDLQSNLSTAISNEGTTRSAAVTTLQNSITSAQSALQTAISNEASIRAANFNTLQNSITSAVDNVQANLKDFVPSTTTKDGANGLVPAPPKKSSEDEILVLTSDGFKTLSESNIFIGAVPSQNGSPQYTGSSQSPQWLNYEDQKMSISGQTSAVDAGSYDVTFTPIGLYCWADGTRSSRAVTWRIYPKVVTIPTAAVTEFEYSGSEISLNVTNPNSDCTSQTGTAKATNSSTYTAVFKLKSTTNYVFSDGTVSDKSISWKIKPKSVTIPTASVTEFTYTGDTITLSVTNPNSDCLNQSGATWAVNSGNYSSTYKLKSTTNYVFSDGTISDKIISWKINPKKLAKPTASTTSFTYNKSSQGPTISNYDSNYMTKSGTDTAVAAADYSVTFSLKNTTNTQWLTGDSNPVKIDWSIAVLKLAKPTASTTSFEYDGKSKTLSVSNFNSNYMTQSGSTSEINAGNFSVTFSLVDSTNSKWSDNSSSSVQINWQITRKKLTAAQSTFSQNGTLTYTGNVQTVSISGYDSNYHDLSSDTSKTNAGNYVAEITPKSNYAFSDGSVTAKSCNWSIGVYKLPKPTAAVTEFEYTGATFTLDVENYNSTYMTRSGIYSQSAEGSYSVTFSLKDKNNYAWLEDNSNSDVVIDWIIRINKFTKPTISAGASQEFTGSTLKPTIANYNSAYMTQSGDTSGVNAKTYTITYSLIDKQNTKWSSGDTNDVVLTWVITRKKLTATQSTFSQSGTLTYNGNSQNVTIANFNSSYHSKSSETSATNAGTYTARISPLPNYAFSDGSVTAKSVSWSIAPLELTKPSLSNISYTYDGNEHSPTISDFNSTYENKSGSDTAVDAGTYTINFSLKNSSNTVWLENGVTDTAVVSKTWTISPLRLAKPSASGTFTYDGDEHSPTISNFNSTYENKVGSDTAVNAGTYSINFSLKNSSNTTWDDSTTGEISCSWTINKATATLSLSPDTVTFDNANNYERIAVNADAGGTDVTVSWSTVYGFSNIQSYVNITLVVKDGNNYVDVMPNRFNTTTQQFYINATHPNYNFTPKKVYVTNLYVKGSYKFELGNADDVAEIRRIIAAGYATKWNVGDLFSLSTNYSKDSSIGFDGEHYLVALLGINHNFDVENGGLTHYVDFMLPYIEDAALHGDIPDTSVITKGTVASTDTAYKPQNRFVHFYEDTDSSSTFYKDSLINTNIAPRIFNLLPFCLRQAIVVPDKYTSTYNVNYEKFADRKDALAELWLLDRYEITTTSSYDKTKPYDYFKNGNSFPSAGLLNLPGTSNYVKGASWTRARHYSNSDGACYWSYYHNANMNSYWERKTSSWFFNNCLVLCFRIGV